MPAGDALRAAMLKNQLERAKFVQKGRNATGHSGNAEAKRLAEEHAALNAAAEGMDAFAGGSALRFEEYIRKGRITR